MKKVSYKFAVESIEKIIHRMDEATLYLKKHKKPKTPLERKFLNDAIKDLPYLSNKLVKFAERISELNTEFIKEIESVYEKST